MGLLNIFKKDNKLKGNINLSEYFDPFYHGGDMYIASQHCVHKRVVIPGGPQGYTTIKIPSKIKTKEKLFEFLIREHKFINKKNIQADKAIPQVSIPVIIKPKIYNLFNIIESETTSISVDILVESGNLMAHKVDIRCATTLYSTYLTPVPISYSVFHDYLKMATTELQEKYRNFSETNWREFIPDNYDEPRLCDCSLDKRHTFVSFGTHKNSCTGTPTPFTVHRCCKCGYVHKDFLVPTDFGQIIERVVTEI